MAARVAAAAVVAILNLELLLSSRSLVGGLRLAPTSRLPTSSRTSSFLRPMCTVVVTSLSLVVWLAGGGPSWLYFYFMRHFLVRVYAYPAVDVVVVCDCVSFNRCFAWQLITPIARASARAQDKSRGGRELDPRLVFALCWWFHPK